MNSLTIDDVISKFSLPTSPLLPELPTPVYSPGTRRGINIGLAVESMKRHMTDEGWQIFAGLQYSGYGLEGDGISIRSDVPKILDYWHPSTVVLQDKREWEGLTADRSRDPRMRFTYVDVLKKRPDVFKVTILKDAHANPEYHRRSAEEIGCHAWIVYYNPRIVAHLAPYVRPQHLIRTFHTIDADLVPAYSHADRVGCLLSGALGAGVYPLRTRCVKERHMLPGVTHLAHPGYHRQGCATPEYLQTLSRFKVAICTSSIYGYALRKIIEAVACGCVVITDLPRDDILPGIDMGLVRVHPSISTSELGQLLFKLYEEYSPEKQEDLAGHAKLLYDYRMMTRVLAEKIEYLRMYYDDPPRVD